MPVAVSPTRPVCLALYLPRWVWTACSSCRHCCGAPGLRPIGEPVRLVQAPELRTRQARPLRSSLALAIVAVLMPLAVRAQTTPAPRIVPYKVQVADDVLRDLKDRLARTRLPGEIDNSGWDYGSNLAYVRDLVAYWRDHFDWRAQERRLNQFDQFTTNIDGLHIHFIHQRSLEAERDAAGARARLARINLRVHEGHRSADRPVKIRRARRRRLSRRRVSHFPASASLTSRAIAATTPRRWPTSSRS